MDIAKDQACMFSPRRVAHTPTTNGAAAQISVRRIQSGLAAETRTCVEVVLNHYSRHLPSLIISMVSSRKKQRVSAVDHSDDVQALGSQSSRNRKQKQPTQEELDLTASLFGSARASLTSESDHKSGIKERDAGVQELSDEEETGLDDVEDDQVRGGTCIANTVIHIHAHAHSILFAAICH